MVPKTIVDLQICAETKATAYKIVSVYKSKSVHLTSFYLYVFKTFMLSLVHCYDAAIGWKRKSTQA